MKKEHKKQDEEMLEEYDFRGAVRGKYAGRFAKGIKVVVLDPDVAKIFRDSKTVNETLRACATIIKSGTKRRRTA